MKKIISCTVAFVMVASLSGCATYRPIVDMKGVDKGQYEVDLKECQEYAKEVSPAKGAAVGALAVAGFGAAVGAIIGAFVGQAGRGAAMGASLGGVQGAVSGGAAGIKGQIDVIRNCMTERGYAVLR